MSTESAKALVAAVVDAWNRGDVAAMEELLDSSYVHRDPNAPEVTDLAGFKQWVTGILAAFPDLHVTIEDMIAEGDRVAKLWSSVGTHQGEILGVAPTGRQIKNGGVTIYRVAGDKVVECIWSSNDVGLLQQLGLLPTPEEQTARASG